MSMLQRCCGAALSLADFWRSAAHLDKAPADAKGFFQGAMASRNPYVEAGRFQPFAADTEPVPGIGARLPSADQLD